MTTLAQILASPKHREAIVAECSTWIERYVARRAGLKGLTLKTGISALKRSRPDGLQRAVEKMLPEFAGALEPLYRQFRSSGGRDFSHFLRKHTDEAAQALLAVTDARAAATSNRALAAGYKSMRRSLETELHATMPELARMIGKHLA